MKHLVMMLVLATAVSTASAQTNVAHVNTEQIMQVLPEAIDAQKTLDALVAQWEGELQKMQAEWKRKFDDYDKKKLILSDQARAETEKELRQMDQQIVDFRNKKFGTDGELFKKQNEVMKPIQNKIFKVLEDIAREDGYNYIFDRSGEILLLYANEKRDLTQDVIRRMQTFGK